MAWRDSGARWALEPLGLRAQRRKPQLRQQMIHGVFGGFVERKDPQTVQAELWPCGVDDDFVVEIDQRAFVFARIGGVEHVQTRTQRQPGPDSGFCRTADLPRPGEPLITKLAGFSRDGAPEQIQQHHITQPGAGDVDAQRDTDVVAQPGRQQRNEFGEPRGGARVADFVQGRGCLGARVESAPQGGLAAAAADQLRGFGRGSGASPPDSAVSTWCGSAPAAVTSTAGLTPRSALPRLSSDANSLPDAKLSDQLIVAVRACRPRWRA